MKRQRINGTRWAAYLSPCSMQIWLRLCRKFFPGVTDPAPIKVERRINSLYYDEKTAMEICAKHGIQIKLFQSPIGALCDEFERMRGKKPKGSES